MSKIRLFSVMSVGLISLTVCLMSGGCQKAPDISENVDSSIEDIAFNDTEQNTANTVSEENSEEGKSYMNVIVNEVGSLSANCYFIHNEKTGEAIVVDPGDDASRLVKACDENGVTPVAILLTHGHDDHITAAERVRTVFDIPVYAWFEEEAILGNKVIRKNITWLNDESTLDIAGFSIKVMHTPGHTIGSVCYYIEAENVLFSGDTMFKGTYGRTDMETGDTNMIIESFQKKLYTLPDKTLVYPGHDESTTIAYEKENNFLNWSISDMN